MWITWWKSVEKNLTLTHKMLGFVLKSRWDIVFKHSFFTATIHYQKMWVMTRVALGNAAAREVLLRNHGRAQEYTGRTDAKREMEFQERLRSQMEFGNERKTRGICGCYRRHPVLCPE